jgi:glycosyltransferase involved in cell wall biosynthesis
VTGVSGSERHLLALLPRLDRRRYHVSLLILTDRRRQHAEEYLARLAASGVDGTAVRIRGHVDPYCLWAMASHMRTGHYDLVHTHLIHADLYGALAARLAGVPHIVSTKHNDDAFRQNRLVRPVIGVGNRLCDRVIAISSHLAAFTARVEGVPKAQIRTIHYGVPANGATPDATQRGRRALALPEGTPVVVCIGRLVAQKGHRHLVEAWRRVAAREPEARLFIVGDGPLRRRLEADIARRGLQGRIVLTGWRDDVPDFLDAADLYVHPSRWEGFGLALLEAMAAGKSVVASRVSAIPEIVADGQTGLLVPAEDSVALADAIVCLLGDRRMRGIMGEAGRRRAEQEFGVETMVRATQAVYEEILGDREPRPAPRHGAPGPRL